MKFIRQIAILFGIAWLSECIEAALPFSFPANVIGIVLLLVLLAGKVIQVEHIRELSDFLLGNFLFFFIPVASSIVKYLDLLRGSLAPFLVVCVVSVFTTYGATALVAGGIIRLMKKKEEKQ